jgi:ligand-binding sensor domain-containing protein
MFPKPVFILATLLVTWLAVCPPVRAAVGEAGRPVIFHRLGPERGLSQSTAQAIAQDGDGFLWIGTQDGLNRFDGLNVTVFRHDPARADSLSGNYVQALCADRDGTLWVGTVEGLNRYDHSTGTFTRFLHDERNPASLADNRVRVLFTDRAGTLWVGGPAGADRFDGNGFTHFRRDPARADSLGDNRIISFFEDKAGAFWLGTGKGITRLDRKTGACTNFEIAPVFSMGEDRAGAFWLASNEGFFKFDREKGAATKISIPEAQDFRALDADPDGTLWLGTWGQGLFNFNPATGAVRRFVNRPRQPDSLAHDFIWRLFRDRAGALWAGTDFGGLCRVEIGKFIVTGHDDQRPDSLNDDVVWSFAEDRSGALWVGTNRGLNRRDPSTGAFERFEPSSKPGSLSHNIVGALLVARDGTLWAGTEEGGVNRFDPATKTFQTFRHDLNRVESLSNDWVHALTEAPDGSIWVGTHRGVNRLDPRTGVITRFLATKDRPDALSNDVAWSILADPSGEIWVGTEGGLNRLDPATGKCVRYVCNPARPDTLSHDRVYWLFSDRQRRLWVGTMAGVNRFIPESGTFERFTSANGLPNDVISGIVEDEAGRLWIGTNNGLCRFDPERKTFRTFDVRDGLPVNEFSTAACLRDAGGRLHFGTVRGFVSFAPGDIRDNPYVPPVVLTSFKVFEKPVAGFTGLAVAPLGYRENFFSFEFAALNFIGAEKNEYAYKLDGFDPDWIRCGTRRYASYTNLDPGEYTLRVKAANNDGVWNDTGVSLKIRVLPPPWRTWWAYCLYGLALCGMGFGLYRFQLNRLRTRAKIREIALQAQAAEADREAAQAKAEAAQLRAELADRLAAQNEELASKNAELNHKNAELEASQRQADRIFSALAEALPGTTLDGKYRLDEKIGAGGFGAVFRATHLSLDRPIAVKVFRPVSGNDSAGALERFKREGISVSRLSHPNIVNVMDSGVSQEGIAYLVMELLTGIPLTAELHQRGRLSLARCGEIVLPVCAALAEAHRQGIIHRDIKPDNVFLNRTPAGEVVKVVDFGIAKLVGEETAQDQLTATGVIVGTPIYVAPERVASQSYDGKADVYSLGVMFYEMLTGRPPFLPTGGNVVSVFLAHMHERPPRPGDFAPDLPPEIEEIVLNVLEKDPNARPDAATFAERLGTALKQCGATAETADGRGTNEHVVRATLALGAERFETDGKTLDADLNTLAVGTPSEKSEAATLIVPPTMEQ